MLRIAVKQNRRAPECCSASSDLQGAVAHRSLQKRAALETPASFGLGRGPICGQYKDGRIRGFRKWGSLQRFDSGSSSNRRVKRGIGAPLVWHCPS